MPQGLLKNNREWAARKLGQDPDFFARLSRQQEPRFLWIGCSDSRVPANEIVGLDPGVAGHPDQEATEAQRGAEVHPARDLAEAG